MISEESIKKLVLALMSESKEKDWSPEEVTEKVMNLMKETCPHVNDDCCDKKTKCCRKEERRRASP